MLPLERRKVRTKITQNKEINYQVTKHMYLMKHIVSIFFTPNVSTTINSTLYVPQLSKNLRQISLARLSLRTEKAWFFPGPSFPFPDSSPKPNATALAEARGTCVRNI
jgi:hypothetical protein